MNVCKVCGAASVTRVERSSSGAFRYRCTACQAEWSADAAGGKDRRTLTDRRTASGDRRTAVMNRGRGEHENLVELVQQNMRAIRRLDAQIRQVAEHLGLDLASESPLKSRAS